MLFYLFSLLILHLNHATPHARAPRQAACVTPDYKPGGCIKLTSCDELNNLLKNNAKNATVQNLLRKSLCAAYVRGQPPKVCCPKPTKPPKGGVPGGPKKKECQESAEFRTRVVGGRDAELGAWPWMAALGYRVKNKQGYDFNCGGALISDQWVLTAAHCVLYLPSTLELLVVRLGDLDLDENVQDNATEIDVPIQYIVPHADYSREPYMNDIALLRLSTPVKFTKFIRPICVMKGAEYKSDAFYKNKAPFIMGWGRTHSRGPTSSRLQETTINMVNNSKCAQDYAQERLSRIDERVICAAAPGKDSCQGDSGGPLVFPIVKEKTFYIGGIVSYGIGCASPKYPGVYTRVAAFTDWIEQVTKLSF